MALVGSTDTIPGGRAVGDDVDDVDEVDDVAVDVLGRAVVLGEFEGWLAVVEVGALVRTWLVVAGGCADVPAGVLTAEDVAGPDEGPPRPPVATG